MRIREFSVQDGAQIAALAGQLGYRIREDQARTRLDRIGHDPVQALFVTESESGAVIGWVHIHRTDRLLGDPVCEIGGIVVDEGHRGMGVGGLLLQRSEEWARNAGCSTVKAGSNIERQRSPAFYRGAGYSLVMRQNVFVKEL
ncbi:MAG: GNAT family N-acetyltransferase [Anaerolineae bacterium]|jgi:GNAT superfamily N-acetyltransferase